jgi:serine/threonine protein kinase, bacterial
VNDPSDTQAAPDSDDRTEQTTKIAPGAAETGEAASAWSQSQDDAEDIVPYIHDSPVWKRVILAATLSALLFGLLAGTVLQLLDARKHPSQPPIQPSVKGPIDGTYRVDRYRGAGTTRTPDGKMTGPAPKSNTVETEWWAFQSACSPSSCTATGTRLDDTTHTQIAARLAPGQAENKEMQSLRTANGQWVSDPPYRVSKDCAAGMPGHAMWRFTVAFTQFGDGTLKGQESALIESNECGTAGTVVATPLVATRTGDLPGGLPPLKTK